MNFNLNQEQLLLRDSIEKFLANEYSFKARKRIIETAQGYSPEYWQLFADLGWLGAAFSAEDGGYGGTACDLMTVMQALGKGLVVEPYLANVILSGGMIAAVATQPQKAQYLAPLIAGQQQFALAYAEQQARFNPCFVTTNAEETPAGYALHGSKIAVLNAPNADLLLVTARTSGAADDREGISVFLVEPNAEGLTLQDYKTVDGFRAADITFDQVKLSKAALVGNPGAAAVGLEQVMQSACLALAAEAVGMMEIVLEKTVEYVKTREQFGTTIGSFQVVQHRLVEMFMECEQARSMLYMAAIEADRAKPENMSTLNLSTSNISALISGARYRISKAARFVGQQAVQLHGGMGISDELDIGHYFKRLTLTGVLFGDSDYHLARYIRAT